MGIISESFVEEECLPQSQRGDSLQPFTVGPGVGVSVGELLLGAWSSIMEASRLPPSTSI